MSVTRAGAEDRRRRESACLPLQCMAGVTQCDVDRDPFLSAEYAAMFVSGMQQTANAEMLKVSSCCKHYDAYSLENWDGVDRHHFNAIVTDQDFADTYFPVFEVRLSPGPLDRFIVTSCLELRQPRQRIWHHVLVYECQLHTYIACS